MITQIKHVAKEAWNNKFIRIAIIVMIAITAMAIVLSIALQPGDNYNLSGEEKELQSDIQSSMDRSDARIAEVMVQDGDWSLVKINSTKDRGNYTMVIMNGDKLAMGPSSNFNLGSLVDGAIPDSIIDYLYPEKPQWANFGNDFNSYFPYTRDQVKFVITSFAQQNNIELNRVTIQNYGEITQSIADPYGENRTETREFKFTVNHDAAEYTFRDFYQNVNSTNTYSVLDSNGNVLYSQVVSLY